MTERVLLLAGSVGPERVPARPDPEDGDWYLPLHLRDEDVARERIAAQIAVGADVVVAPTWLTHRRALRPLGETRRAGAWTAAAVRVGRQAVEVGLERREASLADLDADDTRRGRPRPLVAASLPALDDEAESATGRLLPHEAATERDYRDQAGIIADAEPDLILVEGQQAEADARAAITQAIETGLPAWAALTTPALETSELSDWIDWAQARGLRRLLLPGPLRERAAATAAPLPWGALAPSDDPLSTWLEAGAGVVAWLDGANPAVVEPLRSAIDDHERAAIELVWGLSRTLGLMVAAHPLVLLLDGIDGLLYRRHKYRRCFPLGCERRQRSLVRRFRNALCSLFRYPEPIERLRMDIPMRGQSHQGPCQRDDRDIRTRVPPQIAQ